MNFTKSELYRKYLINIKFDSLEGYTVWGTDMEDSENDKLLTDKKNLVLFSDLDTLSKKAIAYKKVFRDESNFLNWLNEEDLTDIYVVNDFSLLAKFKISLLTNRENSLMILNCLNLIQDFSIQMSDFELEAFFNMKEVDELKNYIYNEYFWEKAKDQKSKINKEIIPKLLQDINNTFFKKIIFI